MGPRVVIAAGRGTLLTGLRRIAADAGLRVAATATDAAAAVAAVLRERPDVVVLDADLPGGALVAAAAIAGPHTPPATVVIDEAGTAHGARAAELAGASAYLGGALDADRLADELAHLVGPTKKRPAAGPLDR